LHLAEKILASCATLDGERKQVPVLFADITVMPSARSTVLAA
jgi:hypothetical protein